MANLLLSVSQKCGVEHGAFRVSKGPACRSSMDVKLVSPPVCSSSTVPWSRLGAPADDARLIDAARSGNAAGVINLLRQGVPVDATEADGSTALHWAAGSTVLTSSQALLRAKAKANVANRYGNYAADAGRHQRKRRESSICYLKAGRRSEYDRCRRRNRIDAGRSHRAT